MAGDRMGVPFLNEQVAVGINFIEKQGLKKSNMAWVGTIQPKLIFKTAKEGMPIAAEIVANLHPQPLNTSIVGRTGRIV